MCRRILIVFAAIFIVLVYAEDFDPRRVHVIDRVGNNFLFRGNEPKKNGQFVYNELKSVLQNVAKNETGVVLKDFFLLDFSLLSIELGDRSLENEFFQKNPSLGQWVNWPVIGDLIPPYDVPSEIRKWLAEHIEDWQFDQLPTTTKTLHDWLSTPPTNVTKPLVIYVHCEAGKDRTGEVSGSYYMTYLGWSFQKTLDYDNNFIPPQRNILFNCRNALQWYCYYLYYVQKKPLQCELPNNALRHERYIRNIPDRKSVV